MRESVVKQTGCKCKGTDARDIKGRAQSTGKEKRCEEQREKGRELREGSMVHEKMKDAGREGKRERECWGRVY